ncbi:Bd3614 family nucleic acid deaminase [Andreprevotia chitinilytica]|uniref:Bd3614 family nucleic acid deaminase n=1 Tax=Andreprevotia chitinilytica TaxID=396808 RepID=UPI0005530DA1|nr:Bd3614 family nucleic acid deaminase [Andreprevotia chitinilytica]
MNLDHYLLALTLRMKKAQGGKDAAIVMKNGRCVAIGIASAKAYETAIVNVMHNVDTRGCNVYASYDPTEMCLGLCWQRNVNRIVYVEGFAPKTVCPDDDNIHSPIDLVTDGNYAIPYRIDLPGWQAKKVLLDTFPTDNTKLDTWIDLYNSSKVTLTHSAQNVYNDLDGCGYVYTSRVSDVNEKSMLGRIADSLPVQDGACVTEQSKKDYLWMKIAYALAGAALPDTRVGLTTGHNVAAVMVSSTDTILGWGVNMNRLNGCFHAETSMILAYLAKNNVTALPAGVRVYSTLAPCHMCAGLITTLGTDVPVVVGHIDPRIQDSALDLKRNGSIQRLTAMMPIVQKPIVEIPELRAYAESVRKGLPTPKSFPSLAKTPYPHPGGRGVKPDSLTRPFEFANWMNRKGADLGRTPTTGDWLDAHHKEDRVNNGVTTFLRKNTAPTVLFKYSLNSLKELLDSLVADPGETVILKRGIALIEKIRSKGLIR